MSRLFTRTLGSGPDLVLVHGWGLHSGIWDDIVEPLASQFRLTLVDLPGHGLSREMDLTAPHPHPEGGGRLYLATALAQLAKVTPARAFWLGWSLGGMLALQFAADSPDRVEKLILVAAGPRFTRTPDWPYGVDPALLEQFARDLEHDYEDTLRRFIGLQVRGSEHARETHRFLRHRLLGIGRPDPGALRGALSILRDADLRPALARIACPLLLIGGEHDTLVPPVAGLAVQQLMSEFEGGAEWVMIPGAGHAPFLSHPEPFLRAVTRFLRD